MAQKLSKLIIKLFFIERWNLNKVRIVSDSMIMLISISIGAIIPVIMSHSFFSTVLLVFLGILLGVFLLTGNPVIRFIIKFYFRSFNPGELINTKDSFLARQVIVITTSKPEWFDGYPKSVLILPDKDYTDFSNRSIIYLGFKDKNHFEFFDIKYQKIHMASVTNRYWRNIVVFYS